MEIEKLEEKTEVPTTSGADQQCPTASIRGRQAIPRIKQVKGTLTNQ